LKFGSGGSTNSYGKTEFFGWKKQEVGGDKEMISSGVVHPTPEGKSNMPRVSRGQRRYKKEEVAHADRQKS